MKPIAASQSTVIGETEQTAQQTEDDLQADPDEDGEDRETENAPKHDASRVAPQVIAAYALMPAGVSTAPLHVAVIGGGVIGAACARAAALRGLHVTLLAPGPDPAAASGASAGMLAAQIEPTDEHLLPLAVRGRDLYEDLAASLKDTTGLDIGFLHTGIATVAFDEARGAALFEQVAAQRQAGLRCDWLEAAELRERWPGVAPAAPGGAVRPGRRLPGPGRAGRGPPRRRPPPGGPRSSRKRDAGWRSPAAG